MGIESFLRGIFSTGDLEVRLPGHHTLRLGDGSPPHLTVTIADHYTLAKIMASPSIGAGEAWMDGRLTLQQGTIQQLVELACKNTGARPGGLTRSALRRWVASTFREHNTRSTARRNIHHHYDLSLDLYRTFLDEDLQYSCAYWDHPGITLEEAQAAKKRHIAAKLALSGEHRVLDIGCGWGGMALSIAAWTGAHVDGVTLSTEQLDTARARAEASGLANLASFSLTDYRDIEGPYDRIVSVGMFEHVGRPNYQAYFDQVARLLTDDGVALIHSIGRMDGPARTDPFTAKYIFPGGYIPALSEVLPAVERAGLWVTDIEVLRFHYADTLHAWSERFAKARPKMAELYDERFCRMWEFYLVAAEMSFRYGKHMNFQLQLTKRAAALPVTRGYMAEAEEALGVGERRVA
ncbi:MAG: class I SAM-dependent methyltransferase [Caulobacteraceae bacterium]|nr:class I SAM-dependent methyltransferase [Caulobacteraceae bacterium]